MLSTMQNDYSFTSNDKFLHQSSMSFDLSVVQIFSALTSGATVCVASSETRKDPSLLAKFMQEAGVTVTYFTPTHYALLIEHSAAVLSKCSDYRLAFFAGERLSVRLVNAIHGLKIPATVLNTWSPSELVVQTTIHKVANPLSNDVNIPIGYPLANCRHYIVDAFMNPLPPSLVGEICVGGAQVGAGYINRPDANSKSFIDNPFCSEDDVSRGWTRLFRTGDKGRFLPDGQLEFHGRIAGDKQVKLRGFRVDLGEVEHRIYLESSKIRGRKLVDVSVVARTIAGTAALTDDRQLIAFIVCNHNLSPAEKSDYVTALHEKIGEYLNPYMLPNGYQFLSELPVTIGGKVDGQNLLKRDLELTYPSMNASESSGQSTAKETIDEKVLKTTVQIFKDVLKLPKERELLPTDNFFQLGGQSILLLRLQSKLKRNFKTVPTLPELFKAPTPFWISQRICGKSATLVQVADDSKLKINWREEAQLPYNERFVVPYGSPSLNRSDITGVLVTGVDSFIGLHMLATLLSSRPSNVVFVLGSESRVEGADLLKGLQYYKLLDDQVTEQHLLSHVRCLPGTLAEPHFGMGSTAFRSLGRSVQSIYHLGGRISLLKNYTDLKQLNVGATLDVVELASCGVSRTEIHYLSTWSVPHLQSHSTAMRNADSIDITESRLDHFQPSDDAELVYFKSRWVCEMLLEQAAERGFGVTIFRASAVTASTATGVSEPDDDFVRRMVIDMIDAGSVPDFGIGTKDSLPFVIDFVPVNYLANVLCDISGSEDLRPGKTPQDKNLSIYHISNPHPLPLQDLPSLMANLRSDGKPGSSFPLKEWLGLLRTKATTDAAKLRWTAMKNVCEAGHVMFALDRTETKKALEIVGGYGDGASAECPPVDEAFLARMVGAV